MGNGMRPEVWDDFQDGFRIQQVIEFYASTEGNGALVNVCDINDRAARGAIGRMGTILGKVMGMKIVEFDIEEEVPKKDPKTGRCIECPPGTSGELICPVKADKPHTKFAGYTDAKSSSKKLIKGAFEDGDEYFRTGDLINKDEKGFFYFVDRIGDTFRWKGENVSTTEVSEVVSAYPGIIEANVYGVEIPGSKDGRACLAALTLEDNRAADLGGHSDMTAPELAKLAEKVISELPVYARPLFIRVLASGGPSTGTFKQQKVQLRKEGCDPGKCGSDKLFWWNAKGGKFEPLDADAHAKFATGAIKF